MDLVFISYLGLTGDWCNYSLTEIEKGLFSPFSDVHQVKDTSRGIKKKKRLISRVLGLWLESSFGDSYVYYQSHAKDAVPISKKLQIKTIRILKIRPNKGPFAIRMTNKQFSVMMKTLEKNRSSPTLKIHSLLK